MNNLGTIRDWKFLCTSANFCEVELYGCIREEVVYRGTLGDIPSCWDNYIVQSFDPVFDDCPYLTLNIDE